MGWLQPEETFYEYHDNGFGIGFGWKNTETGQRWRFSIGIGERIEAVDGGAADTRSPVGLVAHLRSVADAIEDRVK